MKHFCVYLHRKEATNEVFYIGQGTQKRAFSKSSRNKKWKELTSLYSYKVEIVKTNLTKLEALALESKLISENFNLVNSKTASSSILELNYDLFNEWFYINPLSQTGLSWKKDNNANSPKNIKMQGDDAGRLLKRSNGKNSAWQLSFYSKNYYVHRIVWLLKYKTLDSSLIIDHKDRNPLNNNITNLQQVTYKVNANNLSIRSDNKSKIRGVSYNKMNNNFYYTATWYANGKQKAKNFSIKKYGEKLALELAIDYRNRMFNG